MRVFARRKGSWLPFWMTMICGLRRSWRCRPGGSRSGGRWGYWGLCVAWEGCVLRLPVPGFGDKLPKQRGGAEVGFGGKLPKQQKQGWWVVPVLEG